MIKERKTESQNSNRFKVTEAFTAFSQGRGGEAFVKKGSYLQKVGETFFLQDSEGEFLGISFQKERIEPYLNTHMKSCK